MRHVLVNEKFAINLKIHHDALKFNINDNFQHKLNLNSKIQHKILILHHKPKNEKNQLKLKNST